jgi:hypothetical protein
MGNRQMPRMRADKLHAMAGFSSCGSVAAALTTRSGRGYQARELHAPAPFLAMANDAQRRAFGRAFERSHQGENGDQRADEISDARTAGHARGLDGESSVATIAEPRLGDNPNPPCPCDQTILAIRPALPPRYPHDLRTVTACGRPAMVAPKIAAARG